MNSENDHFPGYDLRGCMVIGSVASLCPIFVFLFLAFISYHPVFNTSTIDEMLDYGRIFFISFLSYFASALITYNYRESLAGKLPIWAPVSLLGSILFVAIFTAWELINVGLGGVKDQSGGVAQIGWWMLVSSFFLTTIVSMFTAIASYIYELVLDEQSVRQT